MHSRCSHNYILFVALLVLVPTSAAWGQLWRQLVPVAHVESDPAGDYSLTAEQGPWLVMAATFSGDGAEDMARELVLELRKRFNMTAYIHEMSFDFSNDSPGRGLDDYGAPVRRRYRRGDQVREFAVLAGDFPTIDDPEAQKLLEQIKAMEPHTMDSEDGSSPGMSQLQAFRQAMLAKLGKDRDRGPMGQAFLTRNPLLPREYFVPQGVDDFVVKMNKGVENSLLNCQGRLTVKVATFRGRTLLQTSAEEESDSGGMFWNRKKNKDPLIEAAENAHLLTQELRAHGWEAYEFHDRTESIVTIGSFNQVLQRLADGREMPTRDVQLIAQTFGAAFDTPADPLAGGNSVAAEQRVEEMMQQFNQVMTNKDLAVAPGMHPKHVKILNGRQVERIIPLDIHPHVIEVPRQSISSAYVRQ